MDDHPHSEEVYDDLPFSVHKMAVTQLAMAAPTACGALGLGGPTHTPEERPRRPQNLVWHHMACS